MTTYISLLRGVNVGGKNRVKMDVLTAMYESMGFSRVRAYIQSGNVLFDSADMDTGRLQREIEGKMMSVLGLDLRVLIRTRDELRDVIGRNPFGQEFNDRLYIAFLSAAMENPPMDALNKLKDEREQFVISGKEIFIYYYNGAGRTKFSNAALEKKLGAVSTMRNWNTVNQLAAMSGE
ncbi:MAG: hypothetical protein A2014_05965 [Spirochaetes bacterium GWF1_49_6]|nr:MAG: hypothetical protein A2014_05965 [Spirochaetes bacterium GWF1_49_6]